MKTESFVYSDPSAAHERALKEKSNGAFRVTIEPKDGRYIVTSFYR